MGYEMPERPKFLARALQGLAFWIGHRHSHYSDYPLPEGALVAEAFNLIQSNLPDTLVLRPEYQYSRLVKSGVAIAGVPLKARADLVICSSAAKGLERHANLSAHVRFVLEVKRGSANKKDIDDDLRRLYALLVASDVLPRCFLIVVSESRSPSRFVSNGQSKLGAHSIPGCDGCFHVRRTVKAAASFRIMTSAHYVCLIEVFRDRPKKLPTI